MCVAFATSSSVGVCVCVAFVAVAGCAGYGPELVVRTYLLGCACRTPARRSCRAEQPPGAVPTGAAMPSALADVRRGLLLLVCARLSGARKRWPYSSGDARRRAALRTGPSSTC